MDNLLFVNAAPSLKEGIPDHGRVGQRSIILHSLVELVGAGLIEGGVHIVPERKVALFKRVGRVERWMEAAWDSASLSHSVATTSSILTAWQTASASVATLFWRFAYGFT